jgi:hypothetical protein
MVCADCGARINKWREKCTADDDHKGIMTPKQFTEKDKPPPGAEEVRRRHKEASQMLYSDDDWL